MLLSDFNEIEFVRQIIFKNSNIKFHEIPSGGRRVVACRLDGLSSALWRSVI